MTELILISFLTALSVNAIYIVFNWDGMILSRAGLEIENLLPEFICKPIFTCAICMGAWYSVIGFYIYFGQFDFRLLAVIPVTICLSAIVNTFLECCKSLKEVADDELGRNIKI